MIETKINIIANIAMQYRYYTAVKILYDSTTVVRIPKTRIFSPDNVIRIMECIKTGGDLHAL